MVHLKSGGRGGGREGGWQGFTNLGKYCSQFIYEINQLIWFGDLASMWETSGMALQCLRVHVTVV